LFDVIVDVDALLCQGREAYFTDDGFALGIAYILQVLRQNKVSDV